MLKLENFTLKQRMFFISCMGITGILTVMVLEYFHVPITITICVGILFVILLATLAEYFGRHASGRSKKLVGSIQNVNKGDLTQALSIPGKGEFSWIAREFEDTRKSLSVLVTEIVGGIDQLAITSNQLTAVGSQTSEGVQKQQMETNQVASAINQMAATVQEVAKNASSAAEAAKNADQEAENGKNVVNSSINSIGTLASEVEQAADTLQRLDGDIGNIGDIVNVIRGITEQTNLLALNAAIEAARAGEHGRGFAVVADEVRTLAGRTQTSTIEIEEMINRLQTGAKESVAVMENSRNRAHETVESAAKAGEALDKITSMITTIDQMNAQIAEASNQQTIVADEINQSIVNISQVAEQTANGVQESVRSTEALSSVAGQLKNTVSKFKI
ncbi:MAG: methyl-accepting chemotaxis protein [Gammaproteobacteria bacterium]